MPVDHADAYVRAGASTGAATRDDRTGKGWRRISRGLGAFGKASPAQKERKPDEDLIDSETATLG